MMILHYVFTKFYLIIYRMEDVIMTEAAQPQLSAMLYQLSRAPSIYMC
jgi:hypothetical protein